MNPFHTLAATPLRRSRRSAVRSASLQIHGSRFSCRTPFALRYQTQAGAYAPQPVSVGASFFTQSQGHPATGGHEGLSLYPNDVSI